MKIYLGGAQGVGKTSIARLFVERNPGFSCCSGSELMMKICGVKTRKELEAIDPILHEQAENSGYVKCVRSFPKLVVDGHFELNKAQVDCFNFFVYVECPMLVLENRIKNDATRERAADLDCIKYDVILHSQRLENFKKQYCNALVYTINNCEEIENAVKELEKLANRYTRSYEGKV